MRVRGWEDAGWDWDGDKLRLWLYGDSWAMRLGDRL